MARKARIEGASADPVKVEGFSAYVERFKAAHPDEWASIHLGPLEYGLGVMAEKLKG